MLVQALGLGSVNASDDPWYVVSTFHSQAGHLLRQSLAIVYRPT